MSDYEIIETTDHADWLEKRNLGIGASDAAVIMGVSSWKSPFALWAEKTGQVEPDDLSDVEAVQWGHTLEPIIIDAYRKRTARLAKPQGKLLRSNKYPWAQCTLDALALINNELLPLEVKNVTAYKIADWEYGPPLPYWWQLQHQMLVYGSPMATIAALVGGNRLIWADVERDDIAIKQLIKAGEDFWCCVLGGRPPDIDGSESTFDALKKLHPDDDGSTVQLPGDLMQISHDFEEIKRQIKDMEALRDLKKATIISHFGDASAGQLPDGSGYTLHTTDKRGYTQTVEPTSYRTLRFKKAK